MATRMQQRRGTAAQWTAANPTLAAGEIGYETDTGKFKIGNGTSAWSSLNHYVDGSAILDGAPELLNTLNELAAAVGDDPDFFTTVATNLSNHESDTTNVHGIANTSNLVTLDGTQTLTSKSLTSPSLTGVPTAPTASLNTQTTQIATTEYVENALANLIDNAPSAVNTLNELAAALGDDPNFATTITNAINLKADITAVDLKADSTALASHNSDTTNVHGIANTEDLALQSDISNAITNHNADATNVHGISNTADIIYTADLALHTDSTTNVHGILDTADLALTSDVSTAVSAHNSDQTDVHGIADTAQLATKNYADTAVSTHASDTTNVHGILDTADLALISDVTDAITAHNNETLNVHGIGNTANLATKAYADDAVSTHNQDTTSVHGIADTTAIVLTDDSRLSDTRTPTDDSVSTAKIVNSAVTADKLAGDSVTESKIADGAVTSGKIANGTIVNADINASAAIDWTKLAISSTVSETELGYVDGVTSAIQTQIDAVPGLIATAKAEAIADATSQVNAVIASAPTALNTLDELAAALGDDANYAATVTTALDGKVASYTPIVQKTDSYTLSALTERDSLIEMGKATAQTLTIPTNASVAFPVGTSLDILQTGAGQVTIAGAVGVTVNGTPGLKLRTQWSSATLFKRAENTWVVMGDLSA